jgi:two-component system, cell cycle sensor histidine kinase and response regulator CckA
MNALSPPPAAGVAAPTRWLDWRGSGRILIVDDDAAIRTVVARTVARIGFTSEQASDGPKAIAQFDLDPGAYALVLLDYLLPGMDGKEILSRFQRVKPGVRVILMSGLSRQESMGHFAGCGMAGFLQKPFPLEALVTELRAAIEA